MGVCPCFLFSAMYRVYVWCWEVVRINDEGEGGCGSRKINKSWCPSNPKSCHTSTDDHDKSGFATIKGERVGDDAHDSSSMREQFHSVSSPYVTSAVMGSCNRDSSSIHDDGPASVNSVGSTFHISCRSDESSSIVTVS